MKILRLDVSGQPTNWLCPEDAISLIAKDHVVWSLGDRCERFFGGTNRMGERSYLDVPPIIASVGAQKSRGLTPSLSNRSLFRRDCNLCLYCGDWFEDSKLTRDHVHPRCQGGPDLWENVVSACKHCNGSKGGRTPEQAGMKLLAVPFVPNPFESLFLVNRNILDDQMDYLRSGFRSLRDWVA